jgi:4'-phosphopantetheinyl transferase EntD
VLAIESQAVIFSPRLVDLFPTGALAAELSGHGDADALLPAERKLLSARAADQRRREFAAGRVCARYLLARLNIGDFAVLMGADRQPIWPPSVVGSITHTADFCAAVAADKAQLRALGIDTELNGSVKPELWRRLFLPPEIEWLSSLEKLQRPQAATLLFSAKEAFYKCQYPLTQEKLGFHDAVIQADWGQSSGAFTVQAPTAKVTGESAQPLRGRYLFHEHFITTGMALR